MSSVSLEQMQYFTEILREPEKESEAENFLHLICDNNIFSFLVYLHFSGEKISLILYFQLLHIFFEIEANIFHSNFDIFRFYKFNTDKQQFLFNRIDNGFSCLRRFLEIFLIIESISKWFLIECRRFKIFIENISKLLNCGNNFPIFEEDN